MDEPGWSAIFADLLRHAIPGKLPGQDVLVSSDISGATDSEWSSAAYLLLDLEAEPEVIETLEALAETLTVVPQYKNRREVKHVDAARRAFHTLHLLRGHLVVVSYPSKLRNLSFNKDAPNNLMERGALMSDWSNPNRFERAGRICHLLARVLEHSVEYEARVYWYIDNDEICDGCTAQQDLFSIVSSLRRQYCGPQSPAIHPKIVDKVRSPIVERLLTAVPDIAAGIANEKARSLGPELRRGGNGKVIVAPTGDRALFDVIENWWAHNSASFSKAHLAISPVGGKLRLHTITVQT